MRDDSRATLRGMMLLPILLALAAAPDKPAKPTAGQIADAAPASSWGEIAADDLLVMDFADGQRVVIWLAPDFAPVHVANIRTIARSALTSKPLLLASA